MRSKAGGVKTVRKVEAEARLCPALSQCGRGLHAQTILHASVRRRTSGSACSRMKIPGQKIEWTRTHS